MGKLKQIGKFDGAFFGFMAGLADSVDPHSRILLETTHEAICDAGIARKYLNSQMSFLA
jgi:acyl transferase domain-containing protein